jgi:hypothetical protein
LENHEDKMIFLCKSEDWCDKIYNPHEDTKY